jgi:hypothetical protein
LALGEEGGDDEDSYLKEKAEAEEAAAEVEQEEAAVLSFCHLLAKDEGQLAELSKQRLALEKSLASSGTRKSKKGGGSSGGGSSHDGGSSSATGSSECWEDTSVSSSGRSGGGSSSSSQQQQQREERRKHKSSSVAAMMEALAGRERAAAEKVGLRRLEQRNRFLAWVARRKERGEEEGKAQQQRHNRSHGSSSSSSSSSSSRSRNPRDHGGRELREGEVGVLAEHYFALAAELEDDDLLPEAAEAYQESLRFLKWCWCWGGEGGTSAGTDGVILCVLLAPPTPPPHSSPYSVSSPPSSFSLSLSTVHQGIGGSRPRRTTTWPSCSTL